MLQLIFGIGTLLCSGFGTLKGSDDYEFLNSFSIIPKYGFKRNLSDNFSFELTINFGYQWIENGNDY